MPEHTKAYQSMPKVWEQAKAPKHSELSKHLELSKAFGAVKSIWSCQKHSELLNCESSSTIYYNPVLLFTQGVLKIFSQVQTLMLP